jgi:hypothetical protein
MDYYKATSRLGQPQAGLGESRETDIETDIQEPGPVRDILLGRKSEG